MKLLAIFNAIPAAIFEAFFRPFVNAELHTKPWVTFDAILYAAIFRTFVLAKPVAKGGRMIMDGYYSTAVRLFLPQRDV
jgi:hypothetical protein